MTRPPRGLRAATSLLSWCAILLVVGGAVVTVVGLAHGTGVGWGVGLVVAGVLCSLASVLVALGVERQRRDGGSLGAAIRTIVVVFSRTGRVQRRP